MQVANLHVWLRNLGTPDLEVPYVHASVRTEPGAVHTWECTYGTTLPLLVFEKFKIN